MGDYTNSRAPQGDTFPLDQVAAEWSAAEPLITASKLRVHHLFGIPLVSGLRDPITKKAMVMTDELLAEYIDRSVGLAETAAHISIFPRQFAERQPYDPQEDMAWGYFILRNRPVTSIEQINVEMSNGLNVFTVPQDWIEVGNLHVGQVNIVPLALGYTNGVLNTGAVPGSGAVFLTLFKGGQWMPALFTIKYTAGFKNGMIPKVVNELVGTIAAMEVLSSLAATYARSQSSSLGIDGLSQSTSNPGPELFHLRMEELEKKRDMLIKKIKALYGLTLFASNV